jgi:hypothetical protein
MEEVQSPSTNALVILPTPINPIRIFVLKLLLSTFPALHFCTGKRLPSEYYTNYAYHNGHNGAESTGARTETAGGAHQAQYTKGNTGQRQHQRCNGRRPTGADKGKSADDNADQPHYASHYGLEPARGDYL